MRLAFFGTGEFGLPTLRAVAARHDVALVISQPDRPVGRGQRVAPPAVKAVADELGLPVIQPDDVNSPASVDALRAARARLGLVIAYGQKILSPVRQLFEHRCVNLHGSVLPRWRGAAPVQRAVLAGDAQTGVTLFELVDKMDAGPVLAIARTPISPEESSDALHDRLAQLGVGATLEVIAQLEAGTAQRTPQPAEGVTLARKLSKADSRVTFDRPAAEVARLIRGLWSWPAAQADVVWGDGRRELMTLVAATEADAPAAHPVGTLQADGQVTCGSGVLRLTRVKPAGKREMTWAELHNGRRDAFKLGLARLEPIALTP